MAVRMPQFDWTARNGAGHNLSGTLDASSKEAVVSQLQAQRLIVTNVEAAGSGRSGTVDFAARLEAHSTGAVDYTARLKPPAPPKRRPFAAFAVSAIFCAVGVAILRAAGWPPSVAPAIVAAVFLLLSVAMVAMLIVGLLMPARMSAAVDTLKRRGELSRRER